MFWNNSKLYSKHSQITIWFINLILCLFFSIPLHAQESTAQTQLSLLNSLSGEERRWLSDHPVIRVALAPDYAPFQYDNPEGKSLGISNDYLKLIENKLGIHFEKIHNNSWSDALKTVREHQADMVTVAAQTKKRMEYMLFTKPYVEYPDILFTHSESPIHSIKELAGKKLATIQNFAVNDYIKKNHPAIKLDIKPNIQSVLKAVSLGEIEAGVLNLATASYLIHDQNITNLRIVSNSGYSYKLAFASRKDWPLLNSILDKALPAIQPAERLQIQKKWILIKKEANLLKTQFLIWFFIFLTGVLVIVAIFWIYFLRKAIGEKTKELEESVNQYRNLTENLPDIICRINKDLRHIYVSSNIKDYRGKNPEDYLGKTHREIGYNDAEAKRFEDLLLALFATGKSQELHYQLESSIGKRFMYCRFNPEKSPDGTITQAIGVIQDITAQVLAENALKESEKSLNKAQQIAKIGHWKLNPKTNEVQGSDELFRIFGINKDNVQFESFVEAVHPEDREMDVNTILEAIKTKTSYSLEHRLLMKDSSIKFVRASGEPILDSEENLEFLMGTVQDITEQKQLEMELITAKNQAEKANKTKNNFLSTMSHELRTPMNGILGMTQILKEEDNLNNEQKQFCDIIIQSGNSLVSILSSILDLSRIEAGKLEVQNTTLSIRNLITKIFNLFLGATKAKGIQLESTIDPGIIDESIADPNLINEILSILLGNAIKFTTEGKISINLKLLSQTQKEQIICFEVSDTGIGIDEKNHIGIFKPFSQVDDSSTRQFDGTGLGLSIVKKILDKLNSQITLKSQLGKGSTFSFSLTLNIPETSSNETVLKSTIINDQKDQSTQTNQTKNNKILVVEDDSVNQLVIQKILNHIGFQCDIVANGLDSLQMIEKSKYDLILMDILMPELDGYQTTRQIRLNEMGNKTHIPIIALTAKAMPGDKEKAIDAGMDDYLIKPILLKNLQTMIQKYL